MLKSNWSPDANRCRRHSVYVAYNADPTCNLYHLNHKTTPSFAKKIKIKIKINCTVLKLKTCNSDSVVSVEC